MAAAQTAAATLHLACAELDIWHAVIAFEGAESVVRTGDASERALARLAGLLPNTGSCMAPAYEALLEEMTARSEALKVLVIIHDGEPHDPAAVRHLNACADAARIEVLGLGLELEATNRREMRQLFGERFIDCATPAALAPTLAGGGQHPAAALSRAAAARPGACGPARRHGIQTEPAVRGAVELDVPR